MRHDSSANKWAFRCSSLSQAPPPLAPPPAQPPPFHPQYRTVLSKDPVTSASECGWRCM